MTKAISTLMMMKLKMVKTLRHGRRGSWPELPGELARLLVLLAQPLLKSVVAAYSDMLAFCNVLDRVGQFELVMLFQSFCITG
jgi:hypothetical protein